ncbi:MAG: lytic transglycosylase F [Halieaceae bacterium]
MPKLATAAILLLAIALIAIGLSDRFVAETAPMEEPVAAADDTAAELDDAAAEVDDATRPTQNEPGRLDYLDLITPRQPRDFDAMVGERQIRALVTPSKTFYFFDGAVQRGLSYDALTGFEKFINKELQTGTLKLSLIFIPVTRDQLLPALEAGYGDIAVANLTVTAEREARVDFSEPVLRNVSEVLVTGPASKPIDALLELSGRQLHARASSSYHHSLLALNETLAAQALAPVDIVTVDEHLEDEDLLEMVNAGLIEAIVVDSHKARFWQQIFTDITVHPELVLRSGGNIAWAMRKDSPKLKKMLNKYLRKTGEGTLIGNILLKRYLEDKQYIQNSLSTPEMNKFNATAHLFQKYASRYDFDWLMVMSQAYQESRLDHSARSHTGAVGIMQLLPSTASDKNVNIPDIKQLENNIHAGNKYLRFIRDRYFENEPMTDLDKTLFAFAAYNAGPGRVAKLRSEAEREGLDPNLWFDNVEVIAARRIGRETVQYVSNIYKYWVAYRLSRKQIKNALNTVAAPAPVAG